jgi:hypothetical protein
MMPRQNTLIKTAMIATVMPLTAALAQEPLDTSGSDSWTGVVVSSDATVRCGANESYYPIATIESGSLVKVVGKRQDWLSIELVGDVFADVVGYIKYPEDSTDVFTVVDNTGFVNGDLEVLANNIDSDELYRSWRPVLWLHSGDEVQIINTTVTAPGTLHKNSYTVHTVSMPGSAIGWINSSNINKSVEKLTETPASVNNETHVVSTKNSNPETGDNEGAVVEDASVSVEPIVYVPLSLAELEATWKEITNNPAMEAEVTPLKDMYTELLNGNQDDLVISRISGVRIKQLDIWAGLQEQREKIDSLRADLASKSKKVSEYQTTMSMYGNYEIVGRLSLSHTFDGRLRPFMYRILDQKSGRTLAYLPANKDWELTGLVGQLIGITGKSSWDPTWRVNMVSGERFDILSPSTATVTPDIQ